MTGELTMIKRTMLRMQGKGRGTLALEAGETLQYQLNSTIAATDAKLVLFFDTQNYKVVEGSAGELEALPANVQAAAVVQNNTFLLTGAYEQFDWLTAKQMYLYQDGQIQAENVDTLKEPSVREILNAIPNQTPSIEKEEPHQDAEQKPQTTEKLEKEKVIHPFKQKEEIVSAMKKERGLFFSDVAELETSDILKQVSPESAPLTTENAIEQSRQTHTHGVLPRDVADTDACVLPEEEAISPFSYVFPEAYWKKVSYPYNLGAGYYLAGKIYERSAEIATAIAVPGSYAMNPPQWLEGFQTYLEDEQTKQGYWLFFRNIQTGQPTTLQELMQKSQ